VQHIREDFGTARLDQISRRNDSFAAVYTADDSAAHSPTSNRSLSLTSPRRPIVSLSETHIFSPSLLNKAPSVSPAAILFRQRTIPQLSA